jgi:hypothetical protein
VSADAREPAADRKEVIVRIFAYTDDFPLTKAGFLEWCFIPLMIPLPVESLFRGEVDVSEPYDRTTTVAQ